MQARKWDETIPLSPVCNQLSNVLISSISSLPITVQLCELFGIKSLAVSVSLLSDPFLLSYDDLKEIDRIIIP